MMWCIRAALFSFIVILTLLYPPSVHAQAAPDTYYKATVVRILDEGVMSAHGITIPYQTVRVKIINEDLQGTELTIDHGKTYTLDTSKFVAPNETVVVVRTLGPDNTPVFQIIDTYRLNSLIPLVVLFILLVLILSGWRGIGSIAGMALSIAVIAFFIVPRILAGENPLTVSVIGSVCIMVTTIYLAHGFSVQTTVALFSTFLSLLLTGLLSILFVRTAHLSGLGSEDAYSLKLGAEAIVNFKGLLLGGIIIGVLGVLDDVTTGLSASIFELKKANKSLSYSDLVAAGLRIGREHVSSLVNTLVLAYAGASLPIFITLIVNPNRYPLWSTLNSEMIVEEIIRTLSGSFGLILAVPITTVIAAWYLSYTHRYHSG